MIAEPLRLPLAREYLRQILAMADGIEPMSGRPLADADGLEDEPADDDDHIANLARYRSRAVDLLGGSIGKGDLVVWQADNEGGWTVAPPLWAADVLDKEAAGLDRLYIETGRWAVWNASYRNDAELRSGIVIQDPQVTGVASTATPTADPPPALEPASWWTLHQAVAHLAFQDDDLVADLPGRIRQFEQRGKDGFMFAWLDLLKASNERFNDGWQSVEKAREELRSACEQGLVRAVGVRAGEAAMRLIPPADFISCELWHGRDLGLHPAIGKRTAPATWREVRFDEATVRNGGSHQRELDRTAETSKKPPRRRAPDPEWQAWVAQYRADHPVLPDVDRVIVPAAKAHFAERVTQARVREAFGGGKPGPKQRE